MAEGSLLSGTMSSSPPPTLEWPFSPEELIFQVREGEEGKEPVLNNSKEFRGKGKAAVAKKKAWISTLTFS